MCGSTAAEDGDDLSFAGVLESELDAIWDDLETAILTVSRSFNASPTASYAHGRRGNILIQEIVAAKYAGVLFTLNPTKQGQGIVEMNRGTTKDHVSARVTPGRFKFGKFSGLCIGNAAPIDPGRLPFLGRQIEGIFGKPKNIKWTYRNGQFSIVQCAKTLPWTTHQPALAKGNGPGPSIVSVAKTRGNRPAARCNFGNLT